MNARMIQKPLTGIFQAVDNKSNQTAKMPAFILQSLNSITSRDICVHL